MAVSELVEFDFARNESDLSTILLPHHSSICNFDLIPFMAMRLEDASHVLPYQPQMSWDLNPALWPYRSDDQEQCVKAVHYRTKLKSSTVLMALS